MGKVEKLLLLAVKDGTRNRGQGERCRGLGCYYCNFS